MTSRDNLNTDLQKELYDRFLNDLDDEGNLTLSGEVKFSDGDFAAVFAVLQELPQLRQLNLTGTKVGVDGLKYLAEQRAFPQLQRLGLGSCTLVGDDGLKYLAEYKAFLQLQRLWLNGCTKVGDDGIIYLAEYKAFPQLQELGLNGCTKVTCVSAQTLGTGDA